MATPTNVGITKNRKVECAECHVSIPHVKGVKNSDTTWKEGKEWHRECWYGKFPDFVCAECGVIFPSSQSGKYREHWLKAHAPEGEVGDTLMYLPDGMINDRNYEQVLKENKILKAPRLRCLKFLIDYLDQLEVSYFLSDGTLLAAHRDGGKMIDCDIDCDVSILETDMKKVLDNCADLPDGYLMDTQTGGRCWYGKTHIPFDGVGAKKLTLVDVRDYNDVVVETMSPECDIYTFREEVDDEGVVWMRNNYAKPNQAVHLRRWKKEWLFPLKRIQFEGMDCGAPQDPEAYLTELYGYIGHGAFWNPVSMKYEKKAEREEKSEAVR